MRALGIDYGKKRIGLAISDALGLAAHGLPTLAPRSPEEVVGLIRDVVEEREVEVIIVGLPLNMDGSEGAQAETTRAFAASLEPLGRPVHLVDERLSTERAHRAMKEAGLTASKRRHKADRIAAQFILQVWLDQQTRPA